MRNLIRVSLLFFGFAILTCLIFAFFLLDESLDEFPKVRLSRLDNKSKNITGLSLAEALKQRFSASKEKNTGECLCNRSENEGQRDYEAKFSKTSKNFILGRDKDGFRALSLQNNYLPNNQSNKNKTDLSLFLMNPTQKCPPHPIKLFSHSIEGLILGIAASNEHTMLSVALAKPVAEVKTGAHGYWIRVYESPFKDIQNGFTEFFIGNGNVVLSMTAESDIIVFFRMFDDILFNTVVKMDKEWRNISSSLTFKYSNRTIFQTVGLRFVRKNHMNETQLIALSIIGDSNTLMLRGDLFRLSKEEVPEFSRINNTFCTNFLGILSLRSWCLNPERTFIHKKVKSMVHEWFHTSTFLAKSLNLEIEEIDLLKIPLFEQSLITYDEESGMLIAFAQDLLVIVDFSKNSSDPLSYAYNFEYFERQNFKINRIKLEKDKKFLIILVVKHHKKSMVLIDLSKSEFLQKLSFQDFMQIDGLETELNFDHIKDFHFERNPESDEINVAFLMSDGEIKEFILRRESLKSEMEAGNWTWILVPEVFFIGFLISQRRFRR